MSMLLDDDTRRAGTNALARAHNCMQNADDLAKALANEWKNKNVDIGLIRKLVRLEEDLRHIGADTAALSLLYEAMGKKRDDPR